MVEYPYGRQGDPVVYYEERVDEEQFAVTAEVGDNEVRRDDGVVYVYEAPAEDDPGRGHLSTWEAADDDGVYVRVDARSGDDGEVYERFEEL